MDVHGLWVRQTIGGAVDIYSEPSQSPTVRLCFPAVTTETVVDRVEVRQASHPTRNETILVVDDRPDVAEVASLILQGGRIQGHRCL